MADKLRSAASLLLLFSCWPLFGCSEAPIPQPAKPIVDDSQVLSSDNAASQAKTPQDYLRERSSAKAIEMMEADPKWIEFRDEDQCTPLHVATRFDEVKGVRWLLDHGADVNAIAYNGFTPLHLTDSPAVFELILTKNPNLSVLNSPSGETPLQKAASHLFPAGESVQQRKWRQIVDLLLKAGVAYDLYTAIYLDDFARVKEILQLEPGLANSFQHRSPLRLAAKLGRLEMCRYLIREHRVDVDDFERGSGFPIIIESLRHPQIVQLLIENGADLKTRITWSGSRSGVWIVKNRATALHYAAFYGVPESICLLIDAGVDIFATTRDTYEPLNAQTALDIAAKCGKADNAIAILNHPKFDQGDRRLRQRVLDKSLILAAAPSSPFAEADRERLVKALIDKGAKQK